MAPARDYLAACRKLEEGGRRRARRTQAAIYALLIGIIGGLVAFINQDFLKEQYTWHWVMRPKVLTAAQETEKAGSPRSRFAECANGCPTMVVIPAGKFMMGSPDTEPGRDKNEGPRREVTIPKPIAVGKYEVTFEEYDQFAQAMNRTRPTDRGWGRGRRPVINVSWNDAQAYVQWLSKVTGAKYRLPSEAEWEYLARAGTETVYWWGDRAEKKRAKKTPPERA